MLASLRVFKSVGVRILPILATMWDVGPFCGVLGVYLIGSANMYYALGIWDFFESFLIIWRLVIVNDLNMYELEGVHNSGKMRLGEDGMFVLEPREKTQYYMIVRIMMVGLS